jgi:hypothetical protein
MARGLVWGQATFRKLGRVSTLQRDREWKSLTHRRGRVGLRSDGMGRHRVAFDDHVFRVCLFVLGGLVLLTSVIMLLSWAAATLPPPRMLKSCPEFEQFDEALSRLAQFCAAPTANGNESLWGDDPRTDEPRMIP